MANLKRVWDTTEKKILWASDSFWKLCQVFTDWSNFYVYNTKGKLEELDNTIYTFGPQWKELPEEDDVWVYDTFKPTNLGTPEDTFTATYTFYDYDETVLKTGTVSDYWIPETPADPTREWYKFTGWDPEVWPITKDTNYVAQYEEE